ncbi:MAG: winged helix-turn-helix domain-containing protein [Acidobacteria bacterium]|nr:winged helix-turn-helix domain-containing protein [Acidobacteriota bacterium]MCY3930177.1 winged helix-turn-helix domain-containing protein [Acidobacteriota bacterium]
MGKTDYVLEPILRVLKDGEETPSSEIRLRVAESLGLSEAERKHIAPGSPYAEFKYAVAHGLVRLQAHGHLKKVSTEKIYRLTPRGAELAHRPGALSLRDIKNNTPKENAQALRGGGRAPGSSHGSPARSWPE